MDDTTKLLLLGGIVGTALFAVGYSLLKVIERRLIANVLKKQVKEQSRDLATPNRIKSESATITQNRF